MIALLTGIAASINLNGDVVIDVNGVGYKASLPEKESATLKNGELITLYISTQVREDSISLYGFLSSSTRDLFEKIISVSGIGAKLGLAMISSLSPQGIIDALSMNDVEMLCRVPGIGKKTAQRMIVELSNVKGINEILIPTPENMTVKDVSIALEELGYRKDEIANAMKDIDPELSVDLMIKDTLKKLSGV
ncbi:MAG: Holliday junction branch migration protein RuvA [Acidimicrobiia bacterium]